MKFKSLGGILLWIVVAVIGLFGMIFAWTKIAASRKTKISNTGDSPASTESPEPLSPLPSTPTETVTNDGTPDWLKGSESPFGSEDVLSQEVASSSTETHTPDWMNDNTEKGVQSTPAITSSGVETSAEVPAWLKEAPKEEIHTPEEMPAAEEKPPIPEVMSTQAAPKTDDDIPDWLRGTEEASTVTEKSDEEASTTPEVDEPIKSEETTEKEEDTTPNTTPIAPDDDVPEWLRGASEENSPTTSDATTEEKTIEEPAIAGIPAETP